LQWNNWVQIIKMIKIKAANRFLPRVTALSPCLSLSALPVAHSPCRRMRYTRLFWPMKTRHVAWRDRFKLVEWLHHLFPSHHFPITFNNPLQWFNILKIAFNSLIALGLRQASNRWKSLSTEMWNLPFIYFLSVLMLWIFGVGSQLCWTVNTTLHFQSMQDIWSICGKFFNLRCKLVLNYAIINVMNAIWYSRNQISSIARR